MPEHRYEAVIGGKNFVFNTCPGLFSPDGPDRGTLAMLSLAEFSSEKKVLDLGCGCGIVGIAAAAVIGAENVVMCDISPDAVKTASENAALNGMPEIKAYLSDGFRALPEENFTLILSNPPYHADFSVAKGFIEDGFKRLAMGGKMMMVTKRLDWYKNKLTSVFGGVRVVERDGYFIFIAEKRERKKPAPKKKTLSKKLAKKYKK